MRGGSGSVVIDGPIADHLCREQSHPFFETVIFRVMPSPQRDRFKIAEFGELRGEPRGWRWNSALEQERIALVEALEAFVGDGVIRGIES